MGLRDVLEDDARKGAVVADCLQLISAEVGDKKGMGGMAIKAGYKTVNGIKPGFIEGVVHVLLPEFAAAVDPIVEEGQAKGVSVADQLNAEKSRVADALLAVTDRKAETAKTKIAKSTYQRLRGTAKKHVEAAVPRLAALVAKHVG